ncbi:hypothetical protein SFRURICE_016801 [Spodoptera frugiperda]|uniref:Uncharacterized protein n=3 Tax=Spodoptera TaxID=7106 RepID=A0A835L2T6_SPOEX|nr:uncharacterized protein LOC111353486 [Spodoptera litura]XP_035449720.1 uncharacterized protein LOC118275751 [Spodoptera frugiperda]KAF9413402.1 hypothetical protein HW555_008384 [Spodoptera exigua]KAF9800411.1 hypothetical protein SFRURICE_016801 [Spodoptera frugiperda]
MAQGKLKVKSKLPAGAKAKKNKNKAGKAVTKRPNAPVKSKTAAERNKMKTNVSKMVNAAAEQQLRALATNTPQLSAAQQRVAAAPTAPAPAK